MLPLCFDDSHGENRFNASNSIVFAQYFLSAFAIPITPHSQTVVALSVAFTTAAGKA